MNLSPFPLLLRRIRPEFLKCPPCFLPALFSHSYLLALESRVTGQPDSAFCITFLRVVDRFSSPPPSRNPMLGVILPESYHSAADFCPWAHFLSTISIVSLFSLFIGASENFFSFPLFVILNRQQAFFFALVAFAPPSQRLSHPPPLLFRFLICRWSFISGIPPTGNVFESLGSVCCFFS